MLSARQRKQKRNIKALKRVRSLNNDECYLIDMEKIDYEIEDSKKQWDQAMQDYASLIQLKQRRRGRSM